MTQENTAEPRANAGDKDLSAEIALTVVKKSIEHVTGRQLGQHLRKLALGIDVVSAAGAGDAAEDRCRLASSLIANEQTVFTIMRSSA